jgi:peptide deformylase
VAIRNVALIGDPVLRKIARSLASEEIGSPWVRDLVRDMIDTMHELEGIGIAAPQVGESVQLAVIEIAPDSTRYPDMMPFETGVFVNPRITVLDRTEQGFWEGCLSVPDLRGFVERPCKIRVDWVDLDNRPQTLVATDFLATVFQHELDHLAGTLFVDKVRDMSKLATVENFQRFWLEEAGHTPPPEA